MINAMAEGLARSGEATGVSSGFDRDWMIHAVESMLRQAFPTLIIVGAGASIYFNDACRAHDRQPPWACRSSASRARPETRGGPVPEPQRVGRSKP